MHDAEASNALGVTTLPSPLSVADTETRFREAVGAAGMKVFAMIDHTGEAREVGMDLAETKVIIFGNPRAGTPVMRAVPLMALDLPLKVLIWDDLGVTKVSYTTPSFLAKRYDLNPEMAHAFDGIESLAAAVVFHTYERNEVGES